MSKHPRDRFDDVADGPRVGAHRGLPRRGRGWILFAWAALATGVLVGGGALWLGGLNSSFQFTGNTAGSSSPSATSSATASAQPAETAAPSAQSADTAMTLTVLNGTGKAGLAATGTATLETAGWRVDSDGNASSNDATSTIVYYQTAAQAATARGVVAALGVGSVQQSAAFPNSAITVVLGADYAR